MTYPLGAMATASWLPLCPIKALFYTLVNDYSLTTDRFKGEKTCSNDVVRLVIELIGRYCSDYKQTTNRNLKISGEKILRLAYRLYISVQISMPRSRCKDAVCFSLRAKDYENGISLQMVLNE